MKLSEDFEHDLDHDRQIDFLTDDEDNEAERSLMHNSQSSDSELVATPTNSSHLAPMDSNSNLWPQSYRESMNMYAVAANPSSYLPKESSFHRLSQSLSRKPALEQDSFLTTRLISDSEIVPPSSLSCHSIDVKPSQQCSFSQAVLNGLNILFGIGLLATPYAIKQGGWLSLWLLVLFCCISCYTGILLKRCLESSPELQTYPDIGHAAFGAAGRFGIAIILYTELYAISVEFIVMMGDNLASIFPNASLDIFGTTLASNKVFAIISTLVVLPTVWLRDLSLLSYISAGGILASLLVLLCLVWLGVVDGVGIHPSGTPLNLQNLPVAIGLYSFCFSGHSTFPSQYSSMKNPSQFPTVLMISFFISGILYLGVAIGAYLMFGNATQSQFTLSMPPIYMATKIAVWTTVINPVTKYAFVITPVAMGLEELLPSSHLRYFFVPFLLRSALVVSALLVALTFHHFALIMALIGNLLATLITFIFPCACFLRIYPDRVQKNEVMICVFIMGMGAFCALIGTHSVMTTGVA
ncbi:hypothetical protein V2J09_006677 [Rumex salicifolius]